MANKYRSKRRFDAVYNNKLYAVGSNSDVVLKGEATPTDPNPKDRTYLAETQEVLEYLFNLGHDGVEKLEEDEKKPKP